jgi:ABC-type uncharacterized transport system ATPase subunit
MIKKNLELIFCAILIQFVSLNAGAVNAGDVEKEEQMKKTIQNMVIGSGIYKGMTVQEVARLKAVENEQRKRRVEKKLEEARARAAGHQTHFSCEPT